MVWSFVDLAARSLVARVLLSGARRSNDLEILVLHREVMVLRDAGDVAALAPAADGALLCVTRTCGGTAAARTDVATDNRSSRTREPVGLTYRRRARESRTRSLINHGAQDPWPALEFHQPPSAHEVVAVVATSAVCARRRLASAVRASRCGTSKSVTLRVIATSSRCQRVLRPPARSKVGIAV